MSEEMAQKKAEEIANLAKQEAQIMMEIKEDLCPCCGLATKELKFFNPNLIKAFGWVECTRCGNVYSPKSILKQKQLMASAGIAPAIQSPSILQP